MTRLAHLSLLVVMVQPTGRGPWAHWLVYAAIARRVEGTTTDHAVSDHIRVSVELASVTVYELHLARIYLLLASLALACYGVLWAWRHCRASLTCPARAPAKIPSRLTRNVGVQTDVEDLSRFTVEALKDELRSHDMRTAGTKQDIMDRVIRLRSSRHRLPHDIRGARGSRGGPSATAAHSSHADVWRDAGEDPWRGGLIWSDLPDGRHAAHRPLPSHSSEGTIHPTPVGQLDEAAIFSIPRRALGMIMPCRRSRPLVAQKAKSDAAVLNQVDETIREQAASPP